MRNQPQIPSSEDLQVTLETLRKLAGDDKHHPYLPFAKAEALKLIKEVEALIMFRTQ